MVVGKTGRTTDLTQGTIRATGVSVNVNFGSAGIAHFRDQFSVRSTNARDFSAGGDSSGDQFYIVSDGGDVNNDGWPDVLVGAAVGTKNGNSAIGYARVLSLRAPLFETSTV